jgi:PAS domain S-box-containing protein
VYKRQEHGEQNFDLVLLNLDLASEDGIALMQSLKAVHANSYLPILGTTVIDENRVRATQLGAMDFFSYPLQHIEILTRVRNLLETRLLYLQMGTYNRLLEEQVAQRTADLLKSEASFKGFAELASDWFWEQDHAGKFTKISGPVFEMLGLDTLEESPSSPPSGQLNTSEREQLHHKIATRQPFLDFVYSRNNNDGSVQYLQVSGEPMFDHSGCYIGYRGIGMEITDRRRIGSEHDRFRAAMDAIDIGVLLVQPSSLAIIDANQAACKLVGITHEQMLENQLSHLGLGDHSALHDVFSILNSGLACEARIVSLPQPDGSKLLVNLRWHLAKIQDADMMVAVLTTI